MMGVSVGRARHTGRAVPTAQDAERDRDTEEKRIALLRGEAARIRAAHPWWVIYYGTGSRRLWAFPMMPVPKDTVVSAGGPRELEAGIAEVENELLARQRAAGVPPAPAPPPWPPRRA